MAAEAPGIGVHHGVDRPARRDRVDEGLDSQVGLHPIADGVPNDPVAAGGLDRAEVELFTELVLQQAEVLGTAAA